MVAALALVPSSGAQHQLLKDRIEEESGLKRWHSCHLPVLDLHSLRDFWLVQVTARLNM